MEARCRQAPLCFENRTFVCFYKTSFFKKIHTQAFRFSSLGVHFFHLFCRKTNFCRVNHTLLSFNSCQRYGIFGNKTNIKIKKIIKQQSFDIKTQNIVYKTTFYNISGCFCELENVIFSQEIHKKNKTTHAVSVAMA